MLGITPRIVNLGIVVNILVLGQVLYSEYVGFFIQFLIHECSETFGSVSRGWYRRPI
jgi:hypothetical protein